MSSLRKKQLLYGERILCLLKLSFGPKPIFQIMPIFTSPSQVESIRSQRNSIFG